MVKEAFNINDFEEICQKESIRLTQIRKIVLEIILSSSKAIKAYDILKDKRLSECGAQMPPTVYRALDFLQSHHFIHKIQTLNAYTQCSHPLKRHECYFMICEKCAEIDEFCQSSVHDIIEKNTLKESFSVSRKIIEVIGLCKNCQNEHQ